MSTVTWNLDQTVTPGTSYRGMVYTTYDKLVEVFGKPNISASDKVYTNWGLQFEIGDPVFDDWDVIDATIYDWKEPHGSASHYGEYEWHIGGHNYQSVELVYEALGK